MAFEGLSEKLQNALKKMTGRGRLNEQAVKDGMTVAFMDFENEVPYGFGPRRLLKYAYFLQEEYFPLHDEMCRTEAGLIAEEYSGRCKPGTVKAICQGKQAALFARYFM